MPGHCRLSEDVGPRRVRRRQACAEGHGTGSKYALKIHGGSGALIYGRPMSMTAVHGAPGNRRFTLTLAGLFALAALAVGCGADDSTTTSAPRQSAQDRVREFGLEATSSQAKQAEATLKGYMGARVAGEWKKACGYLAKPIRRLFGRIGSKAREANEVKNKGCAGFVEQSTRKLPASERASLAKVDVTSVRVEDDQGFILYKDSGGTEFSMSLRLEGGTWKLLGISGAQLS